MTYHSVNPDALKDSYGPSDMVVFSLSAGQGMALLNGSVKLEGKLNVTRAGTRVASTDDVRLDNVVGVHSLLAEVSTEAVSYGAIEQTGSQYARYVRMLYDTTRRPTDTFTTLSVAALQSADELVTKAILTGYPLSNNADAGPPSFSFTPLIGINRASGPLAFSKTGEVRLILRLSTVADCLFGGDVDSTTTYAITDLRCTFNSVPDSLAPKGKVTMRTFVSATSSLQSRTSNVTTRFPAICDSISISFISQARRSANVFNNLQCERVSGLQECVLELSNVANGRLGAPINDEAELLRLYLESFGAAKNSITPQQLKALRRYGVGFSLGQPIDLSKTPFTLSITADGISNQSVFVVSIIGHAITEL